MRTVTLITLMLASCYVNKVKNSHQLNRQAGNIRVQTCSRGCYQFVLQPAVDTSQQVYVTNFPDSLTQFALEATNNGNKLRVLFTGALVGNKQTLLGIGPDDRPIPLYALPSFRLTYIRRLPDKPAR